MRYMLLMNYGTSAVPGPDGMPIRQRIEVREVMGAPDPEL